MTDYERIASLIRYLAEHRLEQPDLTTLARHAGMSPFRLHRLFARWTGVTPKDFLQCLTLSGARRLLDAGHPVLTSALESGLSGPGRLHDLCVTLEAASPGELKSHGKGWTISAGIAESPFGSALIAEGPRGICHLAFSDRGDEERTWTGFLETWCGARVVRDDAAAARNARRIFAADHHHPSKEESGTSLRAYVRGTPFQVRVWRALLEVPEGGLTTYGRLAEAIGEPGAARAVGTAVGSNPVALLIPCHRVIRESMAVGGYRWGVFRKQALLAWELARGHVPDSERCGLVRSRVSSAGD